MAEHRLFLSKEALFVQKIHAGDRQAERDFYHYCHDYCLKATSSGSFFSEDHFQDAFLQIWTEIQDGRIFLNRGALWRQPKIKGMAAAPMSCSLRSFIVDICKKQGAKENRSPIMVLTTTVREISDDDPLGFNGMEEEERLRIIHTCIEDMSPHCREILTQFYVKGLSLEQIMLVRHEHVSKDGLKTSKSKCLQRLKSAVLTTYISLQ